MSLFRFFFFCSKNSFTHFVAIIKPEMTLKLKIWEPSCRLLYVCWRNTSEFVVGFVLSFKSIKLLSQQIKYAVQKEKSCFHLIYIILFVTFPFRTLVIMVFQNFLSLVAGTNVCPSQKKSSLPVLTSIQIWSSGYWPINLRLSVFFYYIFLRAS